MADIKTLRLILGDQLNRAHSWFEKPDDSVHYLIAELHQEATYVKHHIQKLVGFFAAMQAFSSALKTAGHQVTYLQLDDTQGFKSLPDLIRHYVEKQGATRFEYQLPDEYRLRKQLAEMELPGADICSLETEHFLIADAEISAYFQPNKTQRMETFYRKIRKRFQILMEANEPLGGQWNFDTDNRKKLKKSDLAEIPEPLLFATDTTEILARIERHPIDYFGEIGEQLVWPVTEQQALQLLDHFCTYCLGQFGTFQDAMTAKNEHAWTLYHSRLSFALNSKILSPMQVVQRAIDEFENRDHINLAQIEGFVRQIIGWREFMRGIYWANMPDYAQTNALAAERPLPAYFWSGDTKMRCMQQSLGQSLEHAYAHHIQRLMVIGNFCLLTAIDPDQVDAWYLGVYIDAIEWVEMPNTRGMSQFADGGLVASKPYVSSGAYINRMSDYCADCAYDIKGKEEDNACPFNSLYWHFMHRHRNKFGNNPRVAMLYKNLDRMDPGKRDNILERAEQLLESIDKL